MELTEEKLKEILKKYPDVIIEFFSPFCSPCMLMDREKLEPLIKKLKEKYGEKLFFERVNVVKNPELAKKFDIKTSMTFLFFKNGKLVNRIFGTKVEKILKEMLES